MADIFELFRQISRPAEESGPVSRILVGLGNPGLKYEQTRHNVGFRAVDALAREAGVRIDRSRFHGLCAECTLAGERVLLIKPQTFMNLSGNCVREALDWYKLSGDRLIVFHDDVSLEPGRIRVRGKGSPGGHNGIRDIIRVLGSETFFRVKIGVGAPPNPEYDLADWVLGRIDSPELDDAIVRAGDAGKCLITDGLEAAMSRFNAKPAGKENP